MKKRLEIPWVSLSRYGWFAVAIGIFGAKDMCAGGGNRPLPPAPASATAPGPAAPPAGTAAAPTDKQVAAPPATAKP